MTEYPNLKPFQPGQSGNPAGRAKGSRNKLGEQFLEDLHADWAEYGKAVIATVRKEKPDQYLKVVASILPKELNVNVNEFEGKSDDDIRRELRELAGALAAFVDVEGDQVPDDGTRPETTH